MKPNTKTLFTIDLQKGFDDPSWGSRNNPDFKDNTQNLLTFARNNGLNIIHVQHSSILEASPLRSDSEGFEFYDFVEPKNDELIIRKHANSAFIGTELDDLLKKSSITDLVFCGLTTDHCVSTTVRMAGNLGYGVELIGDCTATFSKEGVCADTIHSIHLLSLDKEFCAVISLEQYTGQLKLDSIL